MRAILIRTPGGLDALEPAELPRPEPGPGEARVRAMAIGVGRPDALIRTGRYKWMPVAAMVIGAGLMVGYTFVDAHTPVWVMALLMAVFGVSMGLQFQVLMVAIQAAAPLSDIGAATGLITQARTIGASLGLAINGAVMTWALTQQSASLPRDAAAALPEGLVGLSPHAAAALPEATREVVLSHYTGGFNTMFLWIAAIYVVAAGLTLLLKDIQIPKRG